ncbi:MAG TPA: serine/threonine-protein kinase [Candidatus Limnocylindria bacterium]|jgi:serine/threonine-protein kinase
MGSAGEADRDALPGHRLVDRYLLERLVARGGMAHVYRARDERLDRPVAVKVLASPFADDPAYVRRFLEEARIAASITHPNLAHVYDSGEDDGVRFIVMELLEDHRSLRDELAKRGRLPASEAVRVIRDVLAGLSPLHAHGLVHCDVKPGNILIGRDGTKLIDFGIARPQHRQGAGPTSIGSLHSMSPEQLRGDALTPASDIFAVGVALYGALTGRVPFGGDSPAAIAGAQAAGSPPPPGQLAPDVPELLDAAVLQALDGQPERRFESAAAMDAALAAAARSPEPPAGASTSAPDDDTTSFVGVARPSPTGQPVPPARSGLPPTTVFGITVLLAVPVLVAAVVLSGLGQRDQPAEATTRTPTASPTRKVAAGRVKVPDTIGMSEADAERAARSAGLAWRLEWRVDPSKTAGVYDQDPPPGTLVDDGAPFVMYAYRTR